MLHKLDTAEILKKAIIIAQTADVSTPPDSIVLYSISYQKTDINKRLALQYIHEHPQSRMLDDTPCGKQLLELNLQTDYTAPESELMKIWAIASDRFIKAASGNVTAFVENADSRSTFVSAELPMILKNTRIFTINGEDKHKFALKFV